MSQFMGIRKKISKERLSNIILNILIVVCITYGGFIFWEYINSQKNDKVIQKVFHFGHFKEQTLPVDVNVSQARNPLCKIWNCLNTYKCGKSGNDNLTVYIYPYSKYKFSDSEKLPTDLSKEYYEILRSITESKYFTPNPNEACLFLPSIDILNQQGINIDLVNSVLSSLNYWNNGANHLLFSMLPIKFDGYHNLNSGDAIILSSSFDILSYRSGFDVSLPFFSATKRNIDFIDSVHSKRSYAVLSSQLNLAPHQLAIIKELTESSKSKILLLTGSHFQRPLERCEYKTNKCHKVPSVFGKAIFCLIGRGIITTSTDFLDIIAYNCIPVIVADNLILPFEDFIDWSLASIRIREADLHNLMNKLLSISQFKIFEMQQQVWWLYTNYFKDTKTITLTTLKILESRIFPHRAQSIFDWNINSFRFNPLFLPLIAPKSEGFTAVILTYDRIESLFILIQKLSTVSSLQSILVIWNNQQKPPPHLSAFPKILRPLRVIQMGSNKLSNRFYPYAEIETEAILTIDDDIVMLTNDEIEFGFEVWREFPDRIVGFPSRLHKWNNLTMTWNYDSEWTNKISMVLTGAAFYHKFWGHIYTNAMPGNIKKWVDEHMNCEDIAMNFLIASITKKSPIKVTPRKKFKCPECTNTEMLSADLQHMRERSSCIDHFAQIFGHLPLRSVEFRADPVLFKDNFPEKLKRFNDIGNL